MKKYIVYFAGLILISLSISLNYQCHFGSSSVDSLTKNISHVLIFLTNNNIFEVGNVLICANLLFVLVYFIFTKSKDIILPIIVSFLMGFLVNVFNYIPVSSNIAIRIIVFIISLNLMSLAVSLMIYYKLSPSPFECVTILATKLFKKLSYGMCKMIVELICIVISGLISFIFFKNLGEVNLATIIIFLCQGPLIDFYNKLLKKTEILERI